MADLKQKIIGLIEHLKREKIIEWNAFYDLNSQAFEDIVSLLKNKLQETYPQTKLKHMMKSVHYANGFSDEHLKQSAFVLDEIEQYLTANKFLDHDASVNYFNRKITSSDFAVNPTALVGVMVDSLLISKNRGKKEAVPINKPIMPPPWIAFPEIERYSIGWRMGYGETYIDQWGEWYDSLAEEEAKTYQELFPEPVTWNGYWEEEDTCDYYEREGFVIELWREKGTPKYSLDQIRKVALEKKPIEYIFFWKTESSHGENVTKGCFSQWWKSDFRSMNHTYSCMEQFMMANKAELFGDQEIREQISQCSSPRQIKALGRKVRNFDETIWNEIKYAIVLNGNYLKFTQNSELRKFLLSTGDSVLVEASPYDGIWGIKMGETDENARNPLKWNGENLLGFALMEVRDEIRRVWKNADICS